MAISYLRNAECYALNGEAPIRVLCSSTDEKPIEGIPANSTLEEQDTGKKYYFTGTEWVEKSGGGSGGGDGDMKKSVYDADGSVEDAGGIAPYVEEHGGSGGNEFVINFTIGMDDTVVADKTMEEIESAMMVGKRLIGRATGYYTDFHFMGDNFVNSMIVPEDNEMMVLTIEFPEDGEIWTASYKTYTLTPAE